MATFTTFGSYLIQLLFCLSHAVDVTFCMDDFFVSLDALDPNHGSCRYSYIVQLPATAHSLSRNAYPQSHYLQSCLSSINTHLSQSHSCGACPRTSQSPMSINIHKLSPKLPFFLLHLLRMLKIWCQSTAFPYGVASYCGCLPHACSMVVS